MRKKYEDERAWGVREKLRRRDGEKDKIKGEEKHKCIL